LPSTQRWPVPQSSCFEQAPVQRPLWHVWYAAHCVESVQLLSGSGVKKRMHTASLGQLA